MNRIQILQWKPQQADWDLLIETDQRTFASGLEAIKAIHDQQVLSVEGLNTIRVGEAWQSFGPAPRDQIMNISRVWHSLLPMLGYDFVAVAAGWLIMTALAQAATILIVEVAA